MSQPIELPFGSADSLPVPTQQNADCKIECQVGACMGNPYPGCGGCCYCLGGCQVEYEKALLRLDIKQQVLQSELRQVTYHNDGTVTVNYGTT